MEKNNWIKSLEKNWKEVSIVCFKREQIKLRVQSKQSKNEKNAISKFKKKNKI